MIMLQKTIKDMKSTIARQKLPLSDLEAEKVVLIRKTHLTVELKKY